MSRDCPWGTGVSANVVVGPARGGSVRLDGTPQTQSAGVPASASVGGSALARETTLVLTELTDSPPSTLIDDSPIYRLEPLDLTLAQAGMLRLPSSNLQGARAPSQVYYTPSLSEPFAPIAGSYQNAGFNDAPWSRGGYYLVARPLDALAACERPAEPAPPATVLAAECPCSRRAQGSADPQCARGADQGVSMTIGQAGGELSLGNTNFTAGSGISALATFPPGALNECTGVTLTELSTPPPAGLVDFSPIFELGPRSLVLSAPGQLRLPGKNRPGSLSGLAIYYAPSLDQPFSRLPDSYANAGFYQATLTRGGYYLVAYPESFLPAQCH